MAGDEGEAGQEGGLLRFQEMGWLILKGAFVLYSGLSTKHFSTAHSHLSAGLNIH